MGGGPKLVADRFPVVLLRGGDGIAVDRLRARSSMLGDLASARRRRSLALLACADDIFHGVAAGDAADRAAPASDGLFVGRRGDVGEASGPAGVLSHVYRHAGEEMARKAHQASRTSMPAGGRITSKLTTLIALPRRPVELLLPASALVDAGHSSARRARCVMI